MTCIRNIYSVAGGYAGSLGNPIRIGQENNPELTKAYFQRSKKEIL